MAKHIAIFNDLLDDVELTGFQLMSSKEVEQFEELAMSISWDFTHQVGDKELIYSSGEELLTRIDFKEISNEEYKILNNLFDGSFGFFIGLEHLEKLVDDNEDSIDEDDDDFIDDAYVGHDY